MFSLLSFLILSLLILLLILAKKDSVFIKGRTLAVYILTFFLLVLIEVIILDHYIHYSHWVIWVISIIVGTLLFRKLVVIKNKVEMSKIIEETCHELMIDYTINDSGYTLHYKNGDSFLKIKKLPFQVVIISSDKITNSNKHKIFIRLLAKKYDKILPRMKIKLGGKK